MAFTALKGLQSWEEYDFLSHVQNYRQKWTIYSSKSFVSGSMILSCFPNRNLFLRNTFLNSFLFQLTLCASHLSSPRSLTHIPSAYSQNADHFPSLHPSILCSLWRTWKLFIRELCNWTSCSCCQSSRHPVIPSVGDMIEMDSVCVCVCSPGPLHFSYSLPWNQNEHQAVHAEIPKGRDTLRDNLTRCQKWTHTHVIAVHTQLHLYLCTHTHLLLYVYVSMTESRAPEDRCCRAE